MSFTDILWGTIVPILGNLASLILFIAPWKSVAGVKANENVGSVNGVPFIFMFFQCVLWVSYAFFIKDIAIVPVNAVGALFAIYYTLVFYGALRDRGSRSRIEIGAGVAVLVPSTLATICYFWINDVDLRKTIFGIACNIVCVIFMASPLSTLATVIREKDSKSLTWSLTAAIIFNGTVWMIYGWHVDNMYILAPNALATTMGIIQLLLKICFPASGPAASDPTTADPLLNPV